MLGTLGVIFTFSKNGLGVKLKLERLSKVYDNVL